MNAIRMRIANELENGSVHNTISVAASSAELEITSISDESLANEYAVYHT